MAKLHVDIVLVAVLDKEIASNDPEIIDKSYLYALIIVRKGMRG